MPIGKLLERAMQVIVTLRWTAHHTGEVAPELEKEVRDTLALLYGEKQRLDPDSPAGDLDASGFDDEPAWVDFRQSHDRLAPAH